ncbi:MAG: hypothetical protein M3Y53_02885 [Thermoproteota archaeon]|nr:hypothetical protein [Thermoproteota archaeon]
MNKDRNEFAIGLKQNENFRSITKGESYPRFVNAYDQIDMMGTKLIGNRN